tara:strand:+ start:270 stop:467 length:198 start_codon:yes stop_codon:yes gene_type:complete
MQVTGKLDDLMEEQDWALIFGADGQLKGIFIPPGKEEENVPASLLGVLQSAGIDIHADTMSNVLH